MKNLNLNLLFVPSEEYERPLIDHSTDDGLVSVYFKWLEERLCGLINAHADEYGNNAAIVGCVAWLTNAGILDALRNVHCQIVVQKEDLWRPDLRGGGNRAVLRKRYDALHCDVSRYGGGELVERLSCCSDPSMAPVRCVGNHNLDRRAANPRSHHKFIVFCRVEGRASHGAEIESLIPLSAWSGSFNFTENACLSFENAMHIKQTKIADAFFDEWQQVFALSEPLDWETPWSEPEYRIGT